MYLHYAHLKEIHVKEGDVISAGHVVGLVGDTGANNNSHLHFDIPTQEQIDRKGWSGYSNGYSKQQVEQLYLNPKVYLQGKVFPLEGAQGNTNGWQWLQWTGSVYHPGDDMNIGSGYQDYGKPALSATYGEVVKVLKNNGNWGNHLYIKPLTKEHVMANYAEKDMKLHLQMDGKHAGRLIRIDHDKKRYFIVEGDDAGRLACSRIAGSHISGDDAKKVLKDYTEAESLGSL